MVIKFAFNEAVQSGHAVQTGVDGTPNVASLGSPQLGQPRNLAVGVKVDGQCTLTVNVSYDGSTWLPANYRNTNTAAAATLAGAGGVVFDVTPAPFVQVAVSGHDVNALTAWAYTN